MSKCSTLATVNLSIVLPTIPCRLQLSGYIQHDKLIHTCSFMRVCILLFVHYNNYNIIIVMLHMHQQLQQLMIILL